MREARRGAREVATRAKQKWTPIRTLVMVITASTVLWVAIIVSVASLV